MIGAGPANESAIDSFLCCLAHARTSGGASSIRCSVHLLPGIEELSILPWHFLNFLPEPHGQSSFLPTFGICQSVAHPDYIFECLADAYKLSGAGTLRRPKSKANIEFLWRWVARLNPCPSRSRAPASRHQKSVPGIVLLNGKLQIPHFVRDDKLLRRSNRPTGSLP